MLKTFLIYSNNRHTYVCTVKYNKKENEIRKEDIKFEKPLCDLHFFTSSSTFIFSCIYICYHGVTNHKKKKSGEYELFDAIIILSMQTPEDYNSILFLVEHVHTCERHRGGGLISFLLV